MKKKIQYSLIFAGIIIGIALSYHFYKNKSRNLIEKIYSGDGIVNILVAGRKSYHRDSFIFFAILTLNNTNNNIGITFLPPEFKITMGEGNEGEQICKVPFSKFPKIRQSLNRSLGLDVPFFIKIYEDDFIKFFDLIDGLNLFVLNKVECINNNKFGLNYFDGRKIYQYINCVEKNSIFIKYDRILDLVQTVYHSDAKMSIIKTMEFINKVLIFNRTNLLKQEIKSLLNFLEKRGNIYSTVIPGEYNSKFYEMGEEHRLRYEKNFLTKIVVQYEGAPEAKIRIMNGTGVAGLARKLRNNLMRDGLNVVEFSTSPYPHLQKSIIISRTCDYTSVKRVSEMTGINPIYFVTDNRLLNNITIIIGKDLIK